MNVCYCDASALVKRYAPEAGSAWISELANPNSATVILLSEITLAEVAAALAAKQRIARGITLEERDRALSYFLNECDNRFLLLPVDCNVVDSAVDLTQRYRLRGYDAVQLAAALIANHDLEERGFQALTFIAADDDLIFAASGEGLGVDNPVEHEAQSAPQR